MQGVTKLPARVVAKNRRETVVKCARRSLSSSCKRSSQQRLSQIWAPRQAESGETNEQLSLLIRAGFLRQAYSGVFQLLPLGLRVQDKIEALVDKHMRKLGASKLSLSSITSEALWRQSGRFTGDNPEMFRLAGQEPTGYLLGPTHEEEITSLVAGTISYKDLPLRLYQVSRKYRNELRPRGGLLRTREFLMKDLYTFDATPDEALKTYDQVKQAYVDFFDELKVPYLVADADSGAMGGNMSHEFHFATSAGEDNVWNCDSCSYVANEELVERRIDSNEINLGLEQSVSWLGTTQDKQALVLVLVPQADLHDKTKVDVSKLNSNNLKRALPAIDLTISEDSQNLPGMPGSLSPTTPSTSKTTLHILVDSRIAALRAGIEPLLSTITQTFQSRGMHADFSKLAINLITTDPTNNKPLILNNPKSGDGCPRCPTGSLKVQRAVELGHTFYLGTRYSTPLNAMIELPAQSASSETGQAVAKANLQADARVPMSMGCHGIGVSRLIGAVASVLADNKGLNWPRVIAPYEVVIVPANDSMFPASEEVYRTLARQSTDASGMTTGTMDVVLDDRKGLPGVGFRLKDADLIGYPVIVVVGRGWKDGKVEVQCRRLGVKEEVEKGSLRRKVKELLDKL